MRIKNFFNFTKRKTLTLDQSLSEIFSEIKNQYDNITDMISEYEDKGLDIRCTLKVKISDSNIGYRDIFHNKYIGEDLMKSIHKFLDDMKYYEIVYSPNPQIIVNWWSKNDPELRLTLFPNGKNKIWEDLKMNLPKRINSHYPNLKISITDDSFELMIIQW